MRIETLEVAGIRPAVKAMRHPFESYANSDTGCDGIGPKDRTLAEKLAKAGPPHAKHLRMIQVWADIEAPRYWWAEFDTNRIGVEKISCSTIHKLTSRPLTTRDFEWDTASAEHTAMVAHLNDLIDEYQEAAKHGTALDEELAFRELKQSLPESYRQKRTVMMSYAALRNIYEQRKNHRLREWHKFCDWIKTLPESWMITGENEQAGGEDHE